MMAAVKLLIVFSLLVSVTAPTDVYKLVNSEVQLDTQEKIDQFDVFKWMFNCTFILKYPRESIPSNKDYKDRVDFNTETHSLTLKKLKKTDSGPYTAKTEKDQEITVARYTLYVLDPVQEPEMTFSNRSSDHCNVTCLGLTLTINSSSNYKLCEETVTSTDGVKVTLSLCVNGSHVICNHTNPASSKVTLKQTNQLFPHKPESNNELLPFWVYVVIPIIITIMIPIIIIIIKRHRFWKLQKGRTADLDPNTLYQEVQGTGRPSGIPHEEQECPLTLYETVENQSKASRTRDHKNQTTNGARPPQMLPGSLRKAEGPQTLYVTVGLPMQTSRTLNQTTNAENSNIYDEAPAENAVERLKSHDPQTIYATVCKTGK